MNKAPLDYCKQISKNLYSTILKLGLQKTNTHLVILKLKLF